jgi:hypothetical protein
MAIQTQDLHLMSENSFGHRRATDIAQTNKKHFDFHPIKRPVQAPALFIKYYLMIQ